MEYDYVDDDLYDNEDDHVGPYRDGKIHVVSEKCSTCIFRPGNKMSLQPGRVKDMVDGANADNSAITCHQTLSYAPYDKEPAVCNGYYESNKDRNQTLKLAEIMEIIEFDEP